MSRNMETDSRGSWVLRVLLHGDGAKPVCSGTRDL